MFEQSSVEVRSGRLRGESRDGVRVFRGIPYARAPVGKLRFAAPRPAESWAGVREATRFSPVAPQLGTEAGAIGKLFRVVRGGISEDCLYLNVWAPQTAAAALPVLVYLHGGAFVLGAGSTFIYESSALARRGVVVVTFNYRLGAFGFLDLGGLVGTAGEAPPANLGLRDQLAALDWVRDNIEAFGGDPDNVTIFGESAGAMSIGAHLGLESGSGSRFKRAILQSGAAANVSTPDEAAYVARRFLADLGVEPQNWRRILELPMEGLLTAQRRAMAGEPARMGRLPWQPSQDGELIRRQPLVALGDGAASEIDLVVGTNRDEWKLFVLGALKLRRMRAEELRSRVGGLLARCGGDPEGAAELIEDHRSRFEGDRRWPFETWVSIRSEHFFGLPALELAEAHARHSARTFAYRLEEPSPRFPRTLGACHGLDLGFVFATYRHPLLRPVYGGSAPIVELSDLIQSLWVSFARTGRPSSRAGLEWRAYDAVKRSTFALARRARLTQGSDGRNRHFWPR